MNKTKFLLRTGLALACALALAACRTVQYRQVQADFERAVEAEAARGESPFVDWYQGVADTLTDAYIGKLDEKLRPNAWMLRGVAEWRSKNYSSAVACARRGLAEIEQQETTAPHVAHSRDSVVLTILPGLVQDSKLRDRLQALGTNFLTAEGYQTDFVPQFKAVLTDFEEAKQKFAAPTPSAVKHYWNFQMWRVLQNWNFTLGRLLPGEASTGRAYTAADDMIASQFSSLTGGTNMTSALNLARQAIPADHPYRRIIELEEKP